MKRIGIITFHQALNYGAILQAYALRKFIVSNYNNIDAEIIDYQCPYLSRYYSLKSQKRTNIVKSVLASINFLVRRNRFNSFIKKHLKISSDYYTPDSIYKTNEKYDAFIVGSDQVWNPELTDNDLNYFLKFASTEKRNSYAASIGVDGFQTNIKPIIVSNLKMFNHISLREKSGKEYVDSILDNNISEVNMDPTLLLKKDDWAKLQKGQKKEKYLFVYTIKYSQELINEARSFAQQNKIKVYYVGPYKKNKNVKYIHSPKIEKLLSLIYNADYVFTNSFHGTAFSVIFEKQFYVKRNNNDSRNSRIDDFLDLLDLQERKTVNNVYNSITWEKVRALIEQERERTFEYLKRIIEYGK